MLSRVGRKPIEVPSGVTVTTTLQQVTVKGPKGELKQALPRGIKVVLEENTLKVSAQKSLENAIALAGTIRALLNNHIHGVTQGFSKKLQLVGVGYRAQLAKAKDGRQLLNLTLGLSHPVSYIAPQGVELTSATVTEIEVTGIDKQLVGQVAADIRGICGGIRRPEPYKGKGIRYADEQIILKETKKK